MEQRFVTLESLAEYVQGVQAVSRDTTRNLRDLSVEYSDADNELMLVGHNGNAVQFNHWSLGQFATEVGVPAGYLRRIPAWLARANLENALSTRVAAEPSRIMYSVPGEGETMGKLRQISSTSYGRVWDAQLVEQVQRINADGRWHVPPAFNAKDFVVDQYSTTLYASDRDMFVFLVDENRPISVGGQTYFRGFYAWNSEVGSRTLGLATFLYSYVCSNRIIWGVRDFVEKRIRHTKFAPERLADTFAPALAEMSESSGQPVIDAIIAAKATRMGNTKADVEKHLKARGFPKGEVHDAMMLAEFGGNTGSSGDPTNVWDLVQGGTAAARSIPHTDDRLDMERRWSALLDTVGTQS